MNEMKELLTRSKTQGEWMERRKKREIGAKIAEKEEWTGGEKK